MRNRSDLWCVERAMGAPGEGGGQTHGRLGALAGVGHPTLLIAAGIAALLALGVAASFGLLTPRSGMSRRGALRRNLGQAALRRSAGEVRPTLTWAAQPPAQERAELGPESAHAEPAPLPASTNRTGTDRTGTDRAGTG